MSSTIRSSAGRAAALTTAAIVGLSTAAVAGAGSIDELVEMNQRAWGGEVELLEEVYTPEGMHTATYRDGTSEYTGPQEIEQVAGYGSVELVGPRIDILNGDDEWRWASFATIGGGTACLYHALDGQIVRHDCVLPVQRGVAAATAGLADAESTAAIDEVQARLDGSWGRHATAESLGEVYAPDAVHSARYLNTTKTYDGLEEILGVAGISSGNIDQLGERVDFEAPDGELAWAQVVDIAGGTVCLFRAVEGMITRHDCVLPING